MEQNTQTETFSSDYADSLQYLLTEVNNGSTEARARLEASNFAAGRDYKDLGAGYLAVVY